MSTSYLDQVTAHLASLLEQVPVEERAYEMARCEHLANGNLSVNPRRTSPQEFSEDLFSDYGMRHLVRKDEYRWALSAESPQELITNLLPNDGHLD
jgi:hypothetical protein